MSNIIPESLEIFESVKNHIDSLTVQCKSAVINSAQSLESSKTLVKEAQRIEKAIEDKRKEITKPILDEKKRIDDFAKELTNELQKSIKEVRNQILIYEQEQERIRQVELKRIALEKRKQEEELRLKQEELRRIALEAQQKETENTPIDTTEFEQVKQETVQAINNYQTLNNKEAELNTVQNNNIRKTWTYEVTDISKVPVEYLTINDTAVKQAIKDGIRDIQGLNIFQKESLVIR